MNNRVMPIQIRQNSAKGRAGRSGPSSSSFSSFPSVNPVSIHLYRVAIQKIRVNSCNSRKESRSSAATLFQPVRGGGIPAQTLGLGLWPLDWLHSARMTKPPLILISPSIEAAGVEFNDRSISLSEAYPRAIAASGGLPLTMPMGQSRQLVAECVRRCDGVLITGGDDIEPRLYKDRVPPKLRKTVDTTPDGGERDLRELILIDEVFRQRKPLLAICRGHQMLNIALGGTLLVDIPTEVPGAMNHGRMDKRSEVVHEVQLTRDSLLSKITGKRTLGVNSTHHQAVGRVAELLQVTAASEDGIVESMELKPQAARLLPFMVATQFHPERLVDRYPEHRAIFRAFTQACALSQRKL
jgi:putative glutamine amidotransferase